MFVQLSPLRISAAADEDENTESDTLESPKTNPFPDDSFLYLLTHFGSAEIIPLSIFRVLSWISRN